MRAKGWHQMDRFNAEHYRDPTAADALAIMTQIDKTKIQKSKKHMGALTNHLISSSSIVLNAQYGLVDAELLRNQPIIHPSTINLRAVRCPICNHMLGFVEGRAQIKCYKCKYVHLVDLRVSTTADDLD